MIVVDASALTDALINDGQTGRDARRELDSDLHWAAPAHLTIEVVAAIRGLALGGRIKPGRAQAAIEALDELIIDALDPAAVVTQMWAMRDSLTPYDAAYVAWARELGCALVTSDGRLARAPRLGCEVRLVGATPE